MHKKYLGLVYSFIFSLSPPDAYTSSYHIHLLCYLRRNGSRKFIKIYIFPLSKRMLELKRNANFNQYSFKT